MVGKPESQGIHHRNMTKNGIIETCDTRPQEVVVISSEDFLLPNKRSFTKLSFTKRGK